MSTSPILIKPDLVAIGAFARKAIREGTMVAEMMADVVNEHAKMLRERETVEKAPVSKGIRRIESKVVAPHTPNDIEEFRHAFR